MHFKSFLHISFVAALSLVPVTGFSDGLIGSYLSANQANRSNDYAAAAEYYSKALLQDPTDGFLLQNALLAYVVTGEVDRAATLSAEIENLEFDSQLSDLIMFASSASKEDYASALVRLETAKDRLSPLLFGLLKGWSLVGTGDMTSAIDHFDSMKKPDALEVFAQYHKALALALAGDFEKANTLIWGDGTNTLHINRSSVIAHAQIMSQLGEFERAEELLRGTSTGAADQQMRDLLWKIRSKETVPFNEIRSAKDGMSETLLTMASVLSSEDDDRFVLVYSRLSEYLQPENVQAILLLAETLKKQQQFDLATSVLAQVPTSHPMYLNAEIGRADTLVDAGKPEAGIAVLQGLKSAYPSIARVDMALGDIYSSEKSYRKASRAYTAAIDLQEFEGTAEWFVYYVRAISYERLDEWESAERDFRKALELSPGRPDVLNYLGYSLVEKNMKLDEAQDMIERAVKARPNDGFITDSLGWVLYRVGKFNEAVNPMERAVELMPTDPVINDHLGDVYWMVGREREARFQWSRALSFDPEEKDAVRIRLKLEIGLDTVLANEKAEVSNAN